jgi:hypothetical protein
MADYLARATAIAVIGFLLSGCGGSDASRDRALADLQKKVSNLEKAVERLVADRRRRETTLSWLAGTTLLDPSYGNGYETIPTPLGNMLVSLEDVQPYADGSRVTLWFGNPTNADIHDGSKVTLGWGKRSEAENFREFTLDKPLPRGRWTAASFVLYGVPPKDLAHLELKQMEIATVFLDESN